MHEVAERLRIVEVAKTWMNTPFHDCAGIKGIGVDCAYLPIRILNETGLFDRIPDPPPYSPQVMLHRNDEPYLAMIQMYMHEIPEAHAKPADMVLYKVGRSFCHGGIIVEWPGFIIHPIRDRGVIGSHGIEEGFLFRKPRRFFSLF